MFRKQPNVRLLLTLVIAFSMTMPATIFVSTGLEWGPASEMTTPGMNAEHNALVQTDDVLYEVWIEGDTHETAIMFSFSQDNGHSWEVPLKITTDDYVPISVEMSAGSTALHLVWMNAVSRQITTCYMAYDLAAEEWSLPTDLEGENPVVAAGGNIVAIAARVQNEVSLLLSENNGRLFRKLAPMPGISCVYPSLLLENGELHVACIGQSSGTKGIYYSSSCDTTAWTTPQIVVQADAWMKEITMSEVHSGVDIMWREVSVESIDHYSVEIDTLGTFGEKTLVSSEPVVREIPAAKETTLNRLPPKKWTFIVYLDADNNLDSAGYADMTEMETVGTNIDLNIVVLFDGDTFSGPDTHCYQINPGSRTEIPLTTINPAWTSGELNMGDPQTAIDFATWVFGEYPADRYLWDMWNHGGSWNWAMCSDDTDNDHLTALEVRSIYETVAANTGKTKLFDVAGYDECLMADCSLYYDEMPYIDYMCNSEDSIGFDGWEYDIVLGYLNSNLDMNGEEAAYWVFQAYVDAWGTSGSVTTMSVINATMLATSLAPALNNLAQKAIHEITTYRSDLQAAANAARSWQGYNHQRDLYHFCEIAIASITSGPVHNALQDVLDAAEANPVGTAYGDPFDWQSDRAILIHNQNTNEHGMKIYIASPPYDNEFDTMTFSDTNWDEFYKVLWGTEASDPNLEPTVDIVDPADGGIVVTDSMVTISGTAADDAPVVRVDVAVHTQHWAPALGTNSWTYFWDTTGWAPGWYKIMARSYDGQDFSTPDVHDVLMVDNLPPTITLLDNNGQGEDGTWTGTETITWAASDPSEDPATLDIKLEYSPDAGGSWFTIIDGTDNNDGSEPWDTATAPDSTTYLLRATVTDQASATDSDESDAVFTITNQPWVDLTYPNGGEAWMGGSAQTIWWDMSDSVGNVDTLTVNLYYSTDSGATYPNVIAAGLTGYTANPCSFLWDPVPFLDFTTVRIKVEVSDPYPRVVEDTSLSDMAIDSTAPAPATNARAELEGTGVRIYWDASASPDIDYYEVYYIMNGWDPTGNTYTNYLSAGSNTDVLHGSVGISNPQSYFYQVRAFDHAGHETRTTVQAAKIGKTMSSILNPSGWFMLGSPLVQSDTSLNHVLQGQSLPGNWDYAMAWEATGDHWMSHLTTRPAPLNDLSDIANDMGFWLHINTNARWATAGYITDLSIPMKTGWNLVPYAFATRSMSASAIETHLTTNCAGFDSWEMFDHTAAYRLKTPTGTELIGHGDAIWVHVTADCNWNIINY